MNGPATAVGPVAVGADHGGFELKQQLLGWLREWSVEVIDTGTNGLQSVDYPDFAGRVVEQVRSGRARLGVLVCGTGIGMSIAANRHRGIRAALCHSSYTARMARAHNDANVLCLGGRVSGPGEAREILRVFLQTDFSGGRHERRLAKIDPGK